jgi:hypothetical protein
LSLYWRRLDLREAGPEARLRVLPPPQARVVQAPVAGEQRPMR